MLAPLSSAHLRPSLPTPPAAAPAPRPHPPPFQNPENLVTDRATVVVCNHQSFLDPSLCALALERLNFKCPFKHDLMYIPGVGSCLWLAGHMPINRGSKKDGAELLSQCAQWLKRGCSPLFYAEGKRFTGAGVGDFKPGAFVTAQREQVPLQCVTISGARAMLPPGFPNMAFGQLRITVHPPLPPPLAAPEGLAKEAREAANRAAVDASMAACKELIKGATICLRGDGWVVRKPVVKSTPRALARAALVVAVGAGNMRVTSAPARRTMSLAGAEGWARRVSKRVSVP